MLPTREEAERILVEAEQYNPGAWGEHSRVTARCAEKIALACEGMDTKKAYICGLLHDIGRKFGVKHLGHIYDGWHYMLDKGYDDYDLLIQLCDSLATAEGVTSMEDRMNDVKRRYGSYPQEKWDRNIELKELFEQRTGQSIYEIVKE